MPPPTVIVVHRRENPKKCSVAALEGREGFVFWRYPFSAKREPLPGYVQLSMEGPLLSEADAQSGLLILDATWRLAERMHKAQFADVPVRSLPVWKTAYPRVSKNFDDPPDGLATIEAIYIAYTILGRETTGLLDHYYWKAQFLAANSAVVR